MADPHRVRPGSAAPLTLPPCPAAPRYTTSTGVATTVATHYVDLFVTNPHVDAVSAVACELKVLTTAKLTDVHRQQSLRYAHFLGVPVLLIGFTKNTGDVLIEVVVVS